MNPIGSGVIEGGWEYVRAAYAISVVILAAYVASVVLRYRAEQARRRREEGRGPS
jgi:heme exporter protein D